jgi:hypothetical protein
MTSSLVVPDLIELTSAYLFLTPVGSLLDQGGDPSGLGTSPIHPSPRNDTVRGVDVFFMHTQVSCQAQELTF